jgi:hypothetical protein
MRVRVHVRAWVSACERGGCEMRGWGRASGHERASVRSRC